MASIHVYRSPCGMVTEETHEFDGIRITECVGSLPDKFRTMNYGSVIHPSSPISDGTDAGFQEFLDVLRAVSEKDAPTIVASAVK